MRQIIYFSTAAISQNALDIAGIVAVSYRHNVAANITGLLVASGHRYLQVVEGESAILLATLDRIRHDRRHVGVTVLVDRTIQKRSFDSWSVSFHGEPEFGNFSTLDDLIKMMRKEVADRVVRAQLDCLARQFVVTPMPAVPSPWTLASGYRERSAFDRSH